MKQTKRKKKIKEELTDLNSKVVDYQKDIFKNHSDLFIGKMIGMSLDIELPEACLRDEKGEIELIHLIYIIIILHIFGITLI